MPNLFKLLGIAITFCVCNLIHAQSQEECGTERYHRLRMQNDPAYKASFESHQRQASIVSAQSASRTASTTTYTIPVVVHVLYTSSSAADNISDEQVYSAIEYMNYAFAHQAPYNIGTVGVDVGIKFCLAQKDVNGALTSGIDRVDMSGNSGYVANGITTATELTIKQSTAWNNSKYYNIWVVSEIDNNGGGSGVQGYAYFPGAGSYDGTVVLYNSFGYDPTGTKGFALKSYTNRNITATHEIGHALNLYHTFEGDNSGASCPSNSDCNTNGDLVCDTPPHIRSASNCNVGGTNSCTGQSNDLHVHNFMEYSSDVCQYEFTAGQSTRMRATFASARATLVSTANVTACGCDGSFPIVRFEADLLTPCPGQIVNFTDRSLNAPSAWAWAFPGGSVSSATLQNPSVTYSGVGAYDVSLTVNGQTSRTLTKTNYISTGANASLPLIESFTSSTFVPTGWASRSADASYAWARLATDGSTNFAAGVLNYSYNASGQVDDLRTPYINLGNVSSATLTFKVAHRRYSGSEDTLKVLVSSNCEGTAATVLYNKHSSILYTTASGSGSYVPASSADWRIETIDLSAYAGQQVYLIFRNITDYGNNIYIDDINLTVVTDAMNTQLMEDLIVYPNPASGTLYVQTGQTIMESVEIVNMQGMTVAQGVLNGTTGSIEVSSLQPGMYVARIMGESHFTTRKFTIFR